MLIKTSINLKYQDASASLPVYYAVLLLTLQRTSTSAHSVGMSFKRNAAKTVSSENKLSQGHARGARQRGCPRGTRYAPAPTPAKK